MHSAEASGQECASRKTAEEASKVKSGIAVLIGIDFRSILRSLQEAAVGLRSTTIGTEPQAAKMVALIERAMIQIESASETLSRLHRLDSGHFSIELRRIDVLVLRRDVLLVLKPLLQGKKLIVHADFWSSSRPMAPQDDEEDFDVLLSELVGVALRYAGPGRTLTIGVSAEPSRNDRRAHLSFEAGKARAAMKDFELPRLGS